MNTSYAKKLPKEWQMVTHVFAALGEPTRQKIIMLFEPGEELAIKDIAAQFSLGRTTVVHHLNVLQENGILVMRRKGRETLYSVSYNSVFEALQKMQMFMEQIIWAEIGAEARASSSINNVEEPKKTDEPETVPVDSFISNIIDDFDYDLEFMEETPLLFVNDDGVAKQPQP